MRRNQRRMRFIHISHRAQVTNMTSPQCSKWSWTSCQMMIDATNGARYANDAADPIAYLATQMRLMSSARLNLSAKQRAESCFALEVLADKLGIKNEVITAVSRHGREV